MNVCGQCSHVVLPIIVGNVVIFEKIAEICDKRRFSKKEKKFLL